MDRFFPKSLIAGTLCGTEIFFQHPGNPRHSSENRYLLQYRLSGKPSLRRLQHSHINASMAGTENRFLSLFGVHSWMKPALSGGINKTDNNSYSFLFPG